MKRLLALLIVAAFAAVALSACTSSNSSTAAALPAGSVISMNGGEGTVNNGGSGADFYIWTYEGNQIKIQRSGSVDTSFDTTLANQLVSSTALDFGSVPLDATSSVTVHAYPAGNESSVVADEYHMHADDTTLYKRNAGNTGDDVVTGVHVHGGVTVTFECNYNSANAAGIWYFSNDIHNEGTITTVFKNGSTINRCDLDLETNGVWLNDGSISLKGKDSSAGTDGGNGGYFYGWGGNVAVSRGPVNTSGGYGDNGGSAGWVEWDSNYGTWNSAAITLVGGTGNNGNGGAGNWLGLYAEDYPGPVFNSGAVDLSGGNGTTGGGNAGDMDFSTGQDEDYYAGGDMVNSGSITGNGGNATTAGNGGNGADYIDFQAYGANVRNSGSVTIRGGNGAGSGSTGGTGGYLYAWTDYAYDPYNDDEVAAGSVLYSGNVMADGGSGETGGSAGEAEFYQDSYPATGDVVLVGYSNINLKGGQGHTSGGGGGYFEIEVYTGGQYAMATVLNEADMDLTGGQGVTTYGGNGGDIYIDASYESYANPIESFMMDNSGNLTSKGGDGVTAGGNAGYIELYSSQNVRNTGHLNASGGAASNSTGAGGAANYVDLWAVGNILNTGTVESNGGYGALTGGNADGMELWSEYGMAVNSGNILVNGGNASGTTGTGGSASVDNVDIRSSSSGGPFHSKNTGSVSVKGGSAQTAGADGTFYLDGVAQ